MSFILDWIQICMPSYATTTLVYFYTEIHKHIQYLARMNWYIWMPSICPNLEVSFHPIVCTFLIGNP